MRASRTRIVQAGDHVRRRIERDLHDGAQQRMLGIVSELSSAAEEAGRRDDPRAPALDQLTAAADDTIEALRAIARGIHPAMLDEAGLAAALETLADQAAVPLVVSSAPETRYPPAVESAVWRVIARVVAAAGRGDASAVRVALDDADGRLLALVSVDGMADGSRSRRSCGRRRCGRWRGPHAGAGERRSQHLGIPAMRVIVVEDVLDHPLRDRDAACARSESRSRRRQTTPSESWRS